MKSSSSRCACETQMLLVAFVTTCITISTYLYCIYYVSGTELRSNKQTYGSSKSVTDKQTDKVIPMWCFASLRHHKDKNDPNNRWFSYKSIMLIFNLANIILVTGLIWQYHTATLTIDLVEFQTCLHGDNNSLNT